MKPITKQIDSISDLVPDTRNANKGTQRGLGMVEKSLRSYGAGRSILIDKNGNVIAGNKTLESAVNAGFEEIQVVRSDGKKLIVVQREDVDINSKRGRELAIADNRTSEIGLEWDALVLAEMLDEGVSMDGLFDDAELNRMLEDAASDLTGIAAPGEFKEFGEDIETEYCCPKCSYKWSGKPS